MVRSSTRTRKRKSTRSDHRPQGVPHRLCFACTCRVVRGVVERVCVPHAGATQPELAHERVLARKTRSIVEPDLERPVCARDEWRLRHRVPLHAELLARHERCDVPIVHLLSRCVAAWCAKERALVYIGNTDVRSVLW